MIAIKAVLLILPPKNKGFLWDYLQLSNEQGKTDALTYLYFFHFDLQKKAKKKPKEKKTKSREIFMHRIF